MIQLRSKHHVVLRWSEVLLMCFVWFEKLNEKIMWDGRSRSATLTVKHSLGTVRFTSPE